jgi:hypothetical protein
MMFLECPAFLNQDGGARCGLPAEVSRRFIMRSTDGPLESAMNRCPVGHYFNGPVESLTVNGADPRDPGEVGPGVAVRVLPAEPEREDRRSNLAPAYYLGRPASLWTNAMRPRRRRVSA